MAFVGGFLGGGVSMVPAGKHQVFLWWNTSDRENIAGASYTLTPSSGDAVTVEADEYGRAETMIDAGQVYTVTVDHAGEYKGDGPQMLYAESAQSTPMIFYGEKPLDLRSVYPVGSIYMSVNDTDPSALFGGVWERIAQGRTLIGQGISDQAFAAGEEGGESAHVMTESELPAHSHKYTPIIDEYYSTSLYRYYIDVNGIRSRSNTGVVTTGFSPSKQSSYFTGPEQDTKAAGGGFAQQSSAISRCLYMEAHPVSASAGA